MDPTTALFPGGKPDPSSPAAFKNLQQQAESLLARIQTAYKERTQALQNLAAEKETLVEEQQGAEIRAQQFKLQLDNMAARLAEQDEAMMNLVYELAQEKLARQEEEDKRKRTIKVVEHERPGQASIAGGRTNWANTVSDSGFDSEDDGSADSIFSKRDAMHSPTMSMSSVSTNSPEIRQASDFGAWPTQTAKLRVPHSLVFPKSQPPAASSAAMMQPKVASQTDARNSEAWGVIGILKEENQCLKQRIEELEGALDGCLDVVGRLVG